MGKRQRRVVLPPELPPEIADEDIDVSDEDLEFVTENKDYVGFVSRLDTNSITKHVTRVAEVGEEELEVLYERRSKKKRPVENDGLKTPVLDALPVKALDGTLYYPQRAPVKEETEKSEPEESGDKNLTVRLSKAERRAKLKRAKRDAKTQGKAANNNRIEDGDSQPLQSQATVLAELERDLTIHEAFEKQKHKLAEFGLALLADPVANIKTLKDMLKLCGEHDNRIVKLALLSLSAVFKDIIPGYRIRLPTEKELEMKVSKDVKRTRFYEATLLSSYKAYLRKLLEIEKDNHLQHVVVRCLCTLLGAAPHFNFAETLLEAVVKNVGSQDDLDRKLCCSTVKSLFANEGKHGGKATAEAVRLIADLVKAHNCQLHSDAVEIFLSLKFDEDLWKVDKREENVKPKTKNFKKEKASGELNSLQKKDWKKDKKELITKMREEVAMDYKAAALAPDSRERGRLQSETLASVFETYFRILKHTMQSTASKTNDGSVSTGDSHPLLSPCLHGLGKFSNLLDLDYIGDLMLYLKTLAGSASGSLSDGCKTLLTVSDRLQCCIVAFKVMRNNLDALNVDLDGFFQQLYNLILDFQPERDNGEVLAEALRIMLFEDRQHDMQKAAAFIKRLATFSLCSGSAEGMTALTTVKHLLQKNIKCRNLLENDAGGGSVSGCIANFRPEAADPNQSGALASVLWELNLLSHHYHPSISTIASAISTMASAQNQVLVTAISPQQAFSDLSLERDLSNHKYDSMHMALKKKKGAGSSKPRLSNLEPEVSSLSINEENLKQKFSDHFTVLYNRKENERLKCRLSQTAHDLKLYDDYAKLKKPAQNSKLRQGKKSKNVV